MRVLLTGLTGFIGSHVGRLIVAEGHELTALVRPDSSLWRVSDYQSHVQLATGELERPEELAQALTSARPDLCIHLAWRGWSGGGTFAEGNVESLSTSLKFVDAALAARCRRLVIAGTCYEYRTGDGPITEQTAAQPHDLYGASKHALYLVANQLTRSAGATLAWPRIFYTYGPFEDRRRLVPSIVCALMRDEVARTTAGEQVCDYLHVTDVASAIWHVAKSDHSGPVNIASGSPVTVRDVALTAARLMHKEDRLLLGALPYRAGEPMVLHATGQLLRDLKWTPRYDLSTGLAQTITWWSERNREAGRGGPREATPGEGPGTKHGR